MKRMQEISKKIMRRIYYAYTLRMLKHPGFVHTAIMMVGFVGLAQVVSIPNVWANMLQVRVGDLAQFWIGAFLNTGVPTLVLMGVIVLAALSLPWRLRQHDELDNWAFR